MQFIKPNLLKNQKGVYQLTFDEKWFYIGSSKDLKSRSSFWYYSITSGKLRKHLNIKKVIPETNVIRFEVISTHLTEKEIRKEETRILKEHWNNPFLLNRCPDAETLKGMRPYIGYKPPIKIKKEIIDTRKKVAVFSKKWEFIKICESYSQLKKEFKINGWQLKNILEGKRGQPRNINIKGIDNSGNFIEPIKTYIPKVASITDTHMSKKLVKPVEIRDITGILVCVCNNYRDAASFLKCSDQLVHRNLKHTGLPKIIKGLYKVKYA